MTMSLPVRWFVVALAALGALGCGRGGPDTVPVSGRITAGDRPLPNADVVFTPAEEPAAGEPPLASAGKTDNQGRYALKLDGSRHDGAAPGQYKVRISILDRGGEGRPPRGELIPPEYNRNTTLQFTVPPAGTTQADFHLGNLPELSGAAPPGR
jgi:hypothetical protein